MLVALKHDGKIYEERIASGLRHAEHLMRAVDSLVQTAAISRQDIGLVGYTRGPGSFTGLRIASATAKGLEEGLGVPVVSVPTLIAFGALEQEKIMKDTLSARLVAIDGRKDRYYTSCFKHEEIKRLSEICEAPKEKASMAALKLLRGQGSACASWGACNFDAQYTTHWRDQDLTVEEIAAELKELSDKRAFEYLQIVGPGAESLAAKLKESGFVYAGSTKNNGAKLSAAALCSLVEEAYNQNPAGDDPTQGPTYIRKSQAEEGKK